MDASVLVGILKNRRDLKILLAEHWYRIPARHIPRRKFGYIAFYQPVKFGRLGKRISWYARVVGRSIVPRSILLPNESFNKNASADYVRIDVGGIKKLPRPIKNTSPRRISFGFTTLSRLRTAKNILELYGVADTERMLAHELRRAKIKAVAQHYVPIHRTRRYRLDFAVWCARGKIAIECDNRKAHSGVRQLAKDAIKDLFLMRHGWTILRLKENDLVADIKKSLLAVRNAIRKLGGIRD
jgi:very-short-patch-repair endonuclease